MGRATGCRASAAVLVLGLALSGPAGATLIDRGGGLIYDDVLDITWLQDAGLGGLRLWDDAVAWADALTFGGYDDWRLPTGATDTPVNCSLSATTELACRDNELGYMYYHNLGGTAGDFLIGHQGLFRNIDNFFWSGTELGNHPLLAWIFRFDNGDQFDDYKWRHRSAWAVRPGDVLSVPEPATSLLLAAGLAGMGAARRRGELKTWVIR